MSPRAWRCAGESISEFPLFALAFKGSGYSQSRETRASPLTEACGPEPEGQRKVRDADYTMAVPTFDTQAPGCGSPGK